MENKKKPRIKILVACHKADPNIRQDEIYMPIQVGKALHPELDLGFQCDNTGDNISEKNGSYCELTALYWAWKNLKDVDYIGLCHYRRYLDYKTNGKSVRVISADEIRESRDLIPDIGLFNKYDVVLPCFWSTPHSVWDDFQKNVMTQDLYILYKVIEKYEADYLPAFEKYMLGNRRSGFNMFLMRKETFDAYCGWLFRILEHMETRVSLPDYVSYQRLYGYLGEILMPVYCKAKNLKIKQARLASYTGDAAKKSPIIKQLIKDLIHDTSFYLENIPSKKSLKDSYWEMYLKIDNIGI